MVLRRYVCVIDLVRNVEVLTVVFYDNKICLRGYPESSEPIWMACDADYAKKIFSNTFHELVEQNCCTGVHWFVNELIKAIVLLENKSVLH